ncbi:uncharacterized protein BDW47DRAFT_110709 [Aspergillus candidus]|uniref:Uncharacterized protein n=1 Tax=Aspergillus candidus TaxID=41067 RepID=A0A2I2F3L6_ASPCN|nr:hypothetical protein BDW47DRAFT_110709 [Aspergillus candidus]PLB35234.1 hypothetical protein BDW47DRAFT_110709 [Aspergillus candidus]
MQLAQSQRSTKRAQEGYKKKAQTKDPTHHQHYPTTSRPSTDSPRPLPPYKQTHPHSPHSCADPDSRTSRDTARCYSQTHPASGTQSRNYSPLRASRSGCSTHRAHTLRTGHSQGQGR